MNCLSGRDIKKLATCDERLHVLMNEAIKDCPFAIIITHGHRSIPEQQALFEKGRTAPGDIVTNCDGVNKKSKHNYFPSKAFDFAVRLADGEITWDEHFYLDVGAHIKAVAKKLGIEIIWGGDFEKFKDYPHIELP